MSNLFLVPILIVAVIGLTNFPRRHPDTLAPIQLVTLNGIAALVLLQVATAVATTYWWMALPPGLAAAFALLYLTAAGFSAITACGILCRSLLRPRRPASADVEAVIRPEVDTLAQVVRGTRGIGEINLYRGSANGTEVEAIKTPDGAGIRVGGGLAETLAHFRRHSAGGRRRVGALIRFMLLHELGHLLNGDHLAYQFARAVMLAQLWVLVPLLAWPPIVVAMVIRGARHEELAAIGGMGLLLFTTTVIVLFQRIIAAGFASAREQLADWRATITLTNDDHARLLHAPADDSPFLEKALSALRPPPAAPAWAALLTLTWPQPERIDVRVRQLIAGRSKGRHEPLVWSALAGINVGVLVVLTNSLAGPIANAWGKSTTQAVTLAIAGVLAILPAAILVGRADPTDPFGGESTSWGRRAGTAGVYLAVHAVVVSIGYLMWYAVPPLSPLQSNTAGTVIVVVTFFVAASAYLVGVMVDAGPAVLRRRGDLQLNVMPFLLGFASIVPLSKLLARATGSNIAYPFSPLLLPTFAVFILGCLAMQSNHALVRRLSPLGTRDSITEVTRFRVLWLDVMVDMTDVRRRALFLRLTLIWTSQTAIAFAVVAIIVLRQTRLSPNDAMSMALVLGLFGLAAIAVWPKPKSAAPVRIDRNIDVLQALFQSGRTSPLRPLLERLKPSIADDLRNTSLRTAEREPQIGELRHAAQRMELANAVGAIDIVTAWSADATDILRRRVANGVVHAWPGGPPSAYWTAWAARLAAAAGDAATARSLGQSAARLLPARCDNVRAILVAATVARLAAADGAPLAPRSADVRRLLRSTDSLSDLAAIAPAMGSEGVATLRQVVRSRLWATLHANSRRQMLFLLDIIDAGRQLGEGGTLLWQAAEERLRDLLLDEDQALLRRLGAAAT